MMSTGQKVEEVEGAISSPPPISQPQKPHGGAGGGHGGLSNETHTCARAHECLFENPSTLSTPSTHHGFGWVPRNGEEAA